MKVKLKKNNQINENAGFAAGLAVAGLVVFIAKKFYSAIQGELTQASTNIDKSTQGILNSLKQDEQRYPEAKNLSQKIVISCQKLRDRISKLQQEAQDVDKVADMKEDPAKTLDLIITDHLKSIEFHTAGKKLSPKTRKKIKEAELLIRDSNNIIKNINNLILMVDRKRTDGLWNSVIFKTSMKDNFSKEKTWRDFIKLLVKYTGDNI